MNGVVFVLVGRLIVPMGSKAKTKLNRANVLYVLAFTALIGFVALIAWAVHLQAGVLLGVAIANFASERLGEFCRVQDSAALRRMTWPGFGMLVWFVLVNAAG